MPDRRDALKAMLRFGGGIALGGKFVVNNPTLYGVREHNGLLIPRDKEILLATDMPLVSGEREDFGKLKPAFSNDGTTAWYMLPAFGTQWAKPKLIKKPHDPEVIVNAFKYAQELKELDIRYNMEYDSNDGIIYHNNVEVLERSLNDDWIIKEEIITDES